MRQSEIATPSELASSATPPAETGHSSLCEEVAFFPSQTLASFFHPMKNLVPFRSRSDGLAGEQKSFANSQTTDFTI